MLRSISLGQVPVQSPALWLRPVAALTTAFSALQEGLTASRRYQHLQSTGVSHDAAIRDALDTAGKRSGPIHCAGRI
jgi:hypothetical protein